ncbi:uncharacterized protein L969DRAFT_97194 [Mixia osmundae IAM 14324]|uniref:Uncharacterized protein n=1 Tax=Mixia osmundae (strain CBS 9802 / IAM 14324 / JCM 22182 / KY 12970) TaxID=764103 RepID=G7DW38_MIXOS|nr:uncharacterized protein L969DRAFT_97194 [Mixia osmundae IAM 14324]KEI36458.1 hypothetical protein L969DRAFT_97194 [Mixia osmundae IAM 14324]GAA94844.1 hypothetical protein E5Q_01498 [Mixia osmundae IAM 14324]
MAAAASSRDSGELELADGTRSSMPVPSTSTGSTDEGSSKGSSHSAHSRQNRRATKRPRLSVPTQDVYDDIDGATRIFMLQSQSERSTALKLARAALLSKPVEPIRGKSHRLMSTDEEDSSGDDVVPLKTTPKRIRPAEITPPPAFSRDLKSSARPAVSAQPADSHTTTITSSSPVQSSQRSSKGTQRTTTLSPQMERDDWRPSVSRARRRASVAAQSSTPTATSQKTTPYVDSTIDLYPLLSPDITLPPPLPQTRLAIATPTKKGKHAHSRSPLVDLSQSSQASVMVLSPGPSLSPRRLKPSDAVAKGKENQGAEARGQCPVCNDCFPVSQLQAHTEAELAMSAALSSEDEYGTGTSAQAAPPPKLVKQSQLAIANDRLAFKPTNVAISPAKGTSVAKLPASRAVRRQITKVTTDDTLLRDLQFSDNDEAPLTPPRPMQRSNKSNAAIAPGQSAEDFMRSALESPLSGVPALSNLSPRKRDRYRAMFKPRGQAERGEDSEDEPPVPKSQASRGKTRMAKPKAYKSWPKARGRGRGTSRRK